MEMACFWIFPHMMDICCKECKSFLVYIEGSNSEKTETGMGPGVIIGKLLLQTMIKMQVSG